MRKIEFDDEPSNNSSNQPGESEKLNLAKLKAYLYDQIVFSDDVEKIERALKCFTQSPTPKNDLEINNSQEYRSSWCESFFYAGLLVTAASYLIGFSGVCNGVNSKFCAGSRVIPAALDNYFSNQVNNPNQ